VGRESCPGRTPDQGTGGARLWEKELEPTVAFLTGSLGFRLIGEEGGWRRYGVEDGHSGRYVDLRETPQERRGAWGVAACITSPGG